ncbi:unnamed protein product [Owenia fusiformis]|uniref:EGF-like domain-containing protein n=1 Tax=Owenia fusiformis TaxID=6347 RepID=A0A8S4N1R8_OWEFU|nr:unnamed protein product [Owenia fusiformis]
MTGYIRHRFVLGFLCITYLLLVSVHSQNNLCPDGDECDPLHGRCVSGRCACQPNYYDLCDKYEEPCLVERCGGNGNCIASSEGTPSFALVPSYRCICFKGFSGDNCQVNELCSSPSDRRCQNGGTCRASGINDYTCSCPHPYQGKNCETVPNQCSSYPCGRGGTCLDRQLSYQCVCHPGFTGTNCQEELDFCFIASNETYGYNRTCSDHGRCENIPGDFVCHCDDGYTGVECETKIDPCDSSPCQNSASCLRVEEPFGYTCSCTAGYIGRHCETDKLSYDTMWGFQLGISIFLVIFFVVVVALFVMLWRRLNREEKERNSQYHYKQFQSENTSTDTSGRPNSATDSGTSAAKKNQPNYEVIGENKGKYGVYEVAAAQKSRYRDGFR